MILMALLFISSCKDDDPIDPKAQKLNQLNASWAMQSVSNDGNDVSSQFTGFTLSIDGTNYNTQNGGNPWPASGTYELSGDNLDLILRNDGVEMTIDELTTDKLVLSFSYSAVNGRVNGITGGFTFSMTKQ